MICALYSRLHSSKNVSKCLISPLVQDIVLQVLQIWLVWLSFSHGFLFDKLFYSYREDRVSQKRTIVDKSESLHWRSAVKPSIPSFPFHFFLPLLHTRSNRHFLLFCTTATVGQDLAFLFNIRLFRQSSKHPASDSFFSILMFSKSTFIASSLDDDLLMTFQGKKMTSNGIA